MMVVVTTEINLFTKYRDRPRFTLFFDIKRDFVPVCVGNSIGLSSERYLELQASSRVNHSGDFRATARMSAMGGERR